MEEEEGMNGMCCLFLHLAFYYIERLRQNFKPYFAKVASKVCVDFTVRVDVKRQIGGECQVFKFAHAHLFEAHVCAFEKFRHKAEHGGARKFGDG